MPLAPGTRLGPYEIGAPIGKGGMGEVYRARDTKLDRQVAVKVLPEEFANDEERLARFEREAKLLAALNHPNIASIYGLEESESLQPERSAERSDVAEREAVGVGPRGTNRRTKALVLELVEGPTLAERIEAGPIPVEEATAIARQIAEALEEGHGAGVIHRDLKPGNIKVRDDGAVKVLDYGLAKAWQDEATGAGDSNLSQSPTLTRQGTQVGVILGTAAYMSPEQAKGKRVDRRSDVWAFGAVVYEMLTGKRAFEGDDVSDTLAAVLRSEPDFDRLPRETPAALRRMLQLCLTKDPKRRVHDIADVRLAIDGAFETHTEPPSLVTPRHRVIPWILGAAASILTGLAVWSSTRPGPAEVSRFAYELPFGQELSSKRLSVIAAAPDGRRLIYSSRDGLYVRSMDDLEAHLVPGTEEPRSMLFLSPDGQSVAFQRNEELKRLDLSGGAPVVLCQGSFRSGYWAADGTIFLAGRDGVFRVSANGGTPALVISADQERELLDAPHLLPDGDTLLLTVGTGVAMSGQDAWDDARIEAFSLTSGERTVLLERGRDARYVPSGHLVYELDGGLFAARFDARNLRVTSAPVSVVEGVLRASAASTANFAVTDSGRLFYVAAGSVSQAPLSFVDRTGKVERIDTMPADAYRWPRLSPEGDRVLVVVDGDAWVFDIATGRRIRLTEDSATNYLGWTPSGKEVTYTSSRGMAEGEIWIQPADGSGEARQLTSLGGRVDFDGWAPDGRTFSAHHHTEGRQNQLMVSFEGENAAPETWLDHEYEETSAVFSPDGHYVAYISTQTGRSEIYIRPFPGPGAQTPVSVAGGTELVWARSGEIFYRRISDGMMMAVEVSTAPVLTVGAPVELFPRADPRWATGMSPGAQYDVTDDGQRFLMSSSLVTPSEADRGSGDTIIIVQNWIEELKRRVPN